MSNFFSKSPSRVFIIILSIVLSMSLSAQTHHSSMSIYKETDTAKKIEQPKSIILPIWISETPPINTDQRNKVRNAVISLLTTEIIMKNILKKKKLNKKGGENKLQRELSKLFKPF